MKRGVAVGRGPLAAGLLLAAIATWQVAAPAPVEAAQSGLSWVSVGTWQPDTSAGRVHVALRIVATSHAVDAGVRRYYFPGLQLTLPASSAAIKATDDRGRALPTAVLASSPYGVVVNASFPQRLYSGQIGSFNLDFDLVDPGGSTDRDLHIGRDLVSFPVSAFGSPGTPGSSVTVIFPAGYSVQEQFGDLTSAVDDAGDTIYSTGQVADASAVNAWFTAFKEVPASDFKVRYVTVAPMQVALRYWSDDPGWADQVERVMQNGYPVMRDLIGLGDPSVGTVIVEEATTQGIGGFSGEYDQSGGVIRISYFADPLAILHETAHLWFNGDLASSRWINEGFASYYAEQAVVALGLPDHPPSLSASLMRSAAPLNEWVSQGDPGSAQEAYFYGASLEVARQIAEGAGQPRLRLVWAMAHSGQGPYDPATAEAHSSGNAAGAGTGAGVDSGAGPSGAAAADSPGTPRPNASATASVAPTPIQTAPSGAAAGPPAPPVDWRRLLDCLDQVTGGSYGQVWLQWVVTPAQASLLDRRDSDIARFRQSELMAGGWQMPPDLRQAMTAWDFATAEALLGQVGGILSMRAQISASAPAEGTQPPPSLKLAFETLGTTPAAIEATHELAVLSELAAARLAGTASNGAYRAVGLLGSNPEADLEAARKAFSAGDLDAATGLADSARSAWTGAAGAGQVRLLGAGACLAGLLLLLAALRLNPRSATGPRETARGV